MTNASREPRLRSLVFSCAPPGEMAQYLALPSGTRLAAVCTGSGVSWKAWRHEDSARSG